MIRTIIALIPAKDCLLGGMRLPTIAATARAIYRCVFRNEHMTKLTGSSVFTAINLAIDNYAGTDSLGDHYEYKIPRSLDLVGPKPKLCQSDRVSVVVDDHWKA